MCGVSFSTTTLETCAHPHTQDKEQYPTKQQSEAKQAIMASSGSTWRGRSGGGDEGPRPSSGGGGFGDRRPAGERPRLNLKARGAAGAASTEGATNKLADMKVEDRAARREPDTANSRASGLSGGGGFARRSEVRGRLHVRVCCRESRVLT